MSADFVVYQCREIVLVSCVIVVYRCREIVFVGLLTHLSTDNARGKQEGDDPLTITWWWAHIQSIPLKSVSSSPIVVMFSTLMRWSEHDELYVWM